MTGALYLDWAAMAVSLFNAIILIWLGFAVLLNAERRSIGLWVAGLMLILGGGFFLVHSIILEEGVFSLNQSLNFWWHVGWIPVVLLPYAWYAVMLWYAGFWEDAQSPVHRRHRIWFTLATLLVSAIAAMLIFANPLPSISELVQLKLKPTLSVAGIPVLIGIYPIYILLCIALSLDVVRKPGPTRRIMGDLARRRASPWLAGATLVQILVSILVGLIMFWILFASRQQVFTQAMVYVVAWFDLGIATLIGAAVVMVGQAIVSYEVFTGKSLPRRGLRHYWNRALILAAGYAVIISYGLALPLKAIYNLLISMVLLAVFYALLSWRSYAEREHYIENLRPFITSEGLFDQLLTQSGTMPGKTEFGLAPALQTLCQDLLDARLAYLIPLGPLAPLVGPPLVYPEGASQDLPLISEVAGIASPTNGLCTAIDEERFGAAAWAIPLWSERGRIGMLLLGNKTDGSLYTQEEIEIARSVGERLIDTQASTQLSLRLMALQRQRLAESQVLDQQTRRILHDDVLPRLHAAMLNLSSGSQEASSETIQTLGELHHQIANLLQEMPKTITPAVARLGLVGALRQLIDLDMKKAFDQVYWQIDEGAEPALQHIPAMSAEVLFFAAREAVRNAARHGRHKGDYRPLELTIRVECKKGLQLTVEDNGKGIAEPGGNGGSGQGLALHSAMMAVIGGSLTLESSPGDATRILLSLPETTFFAANPAPDG